MKVTIATNQCDEAKLKLVKILISEINIVVWGERRKMRAIEMVYGVLYDGAAMEPSLATYWQVVVNARRLLTKSTDILHTANRVMRLRIQQTAEEEVIAAPGPVEWLI